MRKTKKYNKTNYIKPFSMGLLLLCSVSLISVGFSSWYSGIGSDQSADVNIEVGDVKELGPFITYDDSMEMFEFCEDGVVDRKEEMISSKGDVYMGFQLNVTNLKEALKTYYSVDSLTDFYITTTLSHDYSLSALFSTYLKSATLGMSASDVSTYDISPITDPTIASKSYTTKFSCTLSDSTIESLNFKVKYSFDFNNEFKSKVYPQLSHNAFTFTFKAEVGV